LHDIFFDDVYWDTEILDAGYLMLDAGYWILDAGYWYILRKVKFQYILLRGFSIIH